eukprot:m.176625 g.176625  ORF g.176625 m.176625 type:complete len:82 (-) comp13534_c0_seq1:4259-4504(-)
MPGTSAKPMLNTPTSSSTRHLKRRPTGQQNEITGLLKCSRSFNFTISSLSTSYKSYCLNVLGASRFLVIFGHSSNTVIVNC